MASDAYRMSGVDLTTLEGMKERIKAFAAMSHGPEVLDAHGSFAGLYQLGGYQKPVLVASVDGVGTKLKIAAHLDHFESVGQDLVSLNVNDILTRGAKPLFFLDYIAFSDLAQQQMDTLIRGIVWGCREVGCALISGETAQMPGTYSSGDFDLAGFVVGVVELGRLIDGKRIECGDILLGIPSSGLHTNGFSLVRRVFNIDENPAVLFNHYEELQHHLGEELLLRHRCYYPMLEPALGLASGLAHITGGGLPGKIPAILPENLSSSFQLGSWEIPAIFPLIQRTGGLTQEEMFSVFNMGLGMVAVCKEKNVDRFKQLIPDATIVGRVVKRDGEAQVSLDGG